jgi:hypothetical protein
LSPEDLISRLLEFAESRTLSVPLLPQVDQKAEASSTTETVESESKRLRSESNLNVDSSRNSFDSQKADEIEQHRKMAADELPLESTTESPVVVYDRPTDEPPGFIYIPLIVL